MTKHALAPWTPVLAFFILFFGTLISLPFRTPQGFFWIYLPINLGVILTLWWGPRVLAAVFLNGLFVAHFLKASQVFYYPLYAFPDFFEVFMAYVLLKERFKGQVFWQSTPKYILLLFAYGFVIPAIISSTLFHALYLTQTSDFDNFWNFTLVTAIGDLTGAIFISLPLFLIATPWLSKRGLSEFPYQVAPTFRVERISDKERTLAVLTLGAALIIALMMPLGQAWYIYGIAMLLTAAWYGLYAALAINTWVFLLAIPFPKIMHLPWAHEALYLHAPATLFTLGLCSLITGSAVTTLTEKVNRVRETESELKKAKELAEEASQAKSDFLARMSHEIRTPLNSVLGMLELLKETQLSKDQERYLTLFSHAGENLKALINDLLDFSKIEAKAVNVENVSYNFHRTIRSVFDILQIKAEEKGLDFHLSIQEDIPSHQWGDATRIRQILFNLIGNALKFTNEGSVTVSVTLSEPEQNKLIIEVDDTGIGIPREKQSHLFSPFFQADAGINRKYGGTGLGLVISKNLVEILGGDLEVKSLAGRGTKFKITLPHRPDLDSHLEVKVAPHIAWSQLFPNQKFNILLVDDSEDNRVLMCHYLKNLPFVCDEAENGEIAVSRFKEKKYDLVFMDMQMPVMTGYKATEVIRNIEATQDLKPIPIIALTATAVIQDLERTLESGCNAYLVKPVKKSQVLEVLAQWLKDTPPAHEKDLDFM